MVALDFAEGIAAWLRDYRELIDFADIYEAWGSLNHPKEVV